MSPLTQNLTKPAEPTVRSARSGASTQASRARVLILLAATISFVLSVSLWFAGNQNEGLFVGIWVPSIISLGAFLVPRRTES